jgi:hypothetical protein
MTLDRRTIVTVAEFLRHDWEYLAHRVGDVAGHPTHTEDQAVALYLLRCVADRVLAFAGIPAQDRSDEPAVFAALKPMLAEDYGGPRHDFQRALTYMTAEATRLEATLDTAEFAYFLRQLIQDLNDLPAAEQLRARLDAVSTTTTTTKEQ